MAPGLLFALTDPGDGPVTEDEFHDWYDHEHGPARMRVPGIVGAYRYQALDGIRPPWLALYELSDPAVLDSPAYQAVLTDGSERDKFIMANLATLDRRIYELISDSGFDGTGFGGTGRAPVLLAVANLVAPDTVDDMTAWYEQEHIPMLLAVPGWRRIRRYRLVGPGPLDDASAGFLSLHELAGPEVLEEPAYRAAVSTPWRDRIVSGALSRERRVLGFRNSF
jgi:hypothetical protein